jgi:hypothetical protein
VFYYTHDLIVNRETMKKQQEKVEQNSINSNPAGPLEPRLQEIAALIEANLNKKLAGGQNSAEDKPINIHVWDSERKGKGKRS